MAIPTLLLIQARDPRDPMLDHEQVCIMNKIVASPCRIITKNATVELASSAWLEGVDAVILGGSGDYSVHHPLSRRWIDPIRRMLDLVFTRSLPGLGLCLGHQLLGLHLGAEVVTEAEGEEVGTVRLHLTSAGRSDGLFGCLDATFEAQTGHSDRVVETPSGAELLVRGDDVECQAVRVSGTPFYSTQFHPDLSWEEARERFLSNKSDENGRIAEADLALAERFAARSVAATALLDHFVGSLLTERGWDRGLGTGSPDCRSPS